MNHPRPVHVVPALLLAVATMPWAFAVDSSSDSAAISLGDGLAISNALAREKRAAARGGWALTALGAAAGGWNSNIYESTSDAEVDSTIVSAAAELRLDHWFGANDRWRTDAGGRLYRVSGDSAVSQSSQKLATQWDHRFTPGLELGLGGSVEHVDAKFVDALGDTLAQPAEHVSYTGEAMLEIDLGRADDIAFGGFYRRRDYEEGDGLNSLDWDEFGGRLRYRHRGERSLLRLSYEYAVRAYDEDLASDELGVDAPGNPTEEHVYHDVTLSFARDVSKRVRVRGVLSFDAKIDQFKGYETWHQGKATLGIDVDANDGFGFGASAFGAYRDYPNRELATGQNLSYQKYGGEVDARWFMNRHWSLFAAYALVLRDANKDTGVAYRDYLVHAVSGGIATAF